MSINTSMLFAVGTTKYQAAGNIAKLVFLAVGLGIAFGRFGLREAIWVLAVSPIAVYVPQLLGLSRYFPGVMRVELASFGALLICVAFTVSILLMIR
jgi:hypothetical protein